MKYALTTAMAKKVDEDTIQGTGLPSMVLMERAALSVAMKTAQIAAMMTRPAKIVAVCGSGNNGADGIATARILTWQGLPCDVLPVGNAEHATAEYLEQEKIASSSGVRLATMEELDGYDIVIDAIFGIGLTRPIEGGYKQLIEKLNAGSHIVVAVDVPSGVDATTGAVLGCAVQAQATVTFGYHKQGLLLYPGKAHAGEVTVADIGFYPETIRRLNPAMYFTSEDLDKIPKRDTAANKGTYGRTLVIAGSKDMSGAAYLSGAAAYRSGCGLVEIFTDAVNADVIKKLLPEAIVTGYREDNAIAMLAKRLEEASTVILGPGLSTLGLAQDIVNYVLENAKNPLIMDADAINIVSWKLAVEGNDFLKNYKGPLIMTPHIGEMMRLTGMTKEAILSDTAAIAKQYALEYNAVLVLKNAVTVVAEPSGNCRLYLNTSGTPALAKGGSGDVLTGIIAGMLALHIEPFSAAAMGVYIHGLCGESAAARLGEHAVLASDLTYEIGKFVR